jgi:Flp pilus assembly protein TadG
MLLKRLFGNRDGSVAPMFALAIIPVIGLVGAAIDYTRTSAARSEMQDALDATALMLSKQAPGLSNGDLNTLAQNYFNALYHNSDSQQVKVAATYSATGGAQLTVSGSGTVPTTISNMLGVSTMDFNSSSTVKWGSTKLRVALVLDNTGSMLQSNKLPALKTATHQLLTILQAAATKPGDVQVSIVPFSRDVKFDTSSSFDQSWFDWTAWDASSSGGQKYGTCSLSGYNSASSCQSAGTCSISSYTSKSSCQSAGTCSISGQNTQSGCQSAGVCSMSRYTTWYDCQYHRGTWTNGQWTSNPGTWTAATWTPDHTKWNGCVMDRGTNSGPSPSNYDTLATTPDATNSATLFPPDVQNNCPGSTMLPLGYDWTALSNAVDAMQANGSTNQTIGLAWGWQTLSEGAPFNVPTLPPDTKPIIILLSDGLNTQDRWYGNGSDTSTQVDGRMKMVCDNVKADASKITIYTVQVNTGGDPTSTVLQNCASDSSMFYAITSSGELVATFQTIGTKLAKLRISQ